MRRNDTESQGVAGRRPFLLAVVLAALLAPPFAMASEGAGAELGLWPIWGAAALQMGIAIVVGLVQASQARYVRLADDQITNLRRDVEQLSHEVRELRDRTVPRSEIDPRMSRLSEKVVGLRDELIERFERDRTELVERSDRETARLTTELKEMRAELTELRRSVTSALALLQPRS